MPEMTHRRTSSAATSCSSASPSPPASSCRRSLTACGGGGGDGSYVGPTETFVEPLDIQSVNGVLDVTIVALVPDHARSQGTTGDAAQHVRHDSRADAAHERRRHAAHQDRSTTCRPIRPPPMPRRRAVPQPAPALSTTARTCTRTACTSIPDIYPQPARPRTQTRTRRRRRSSTATSSSTIPSRASSPARSGSTSTGSATTIRPGTYWYHPHLHGSQRDAGGQRHGRRADHRGCRSTRCRRSPPRRERSSCSRRRSTIATGKLEDFGDGRGHHHQRAAVHHQRRARAAHRHEEPAKCRTGGSSTPAPSRC